VADIRLVPTIRPVPYDVVFDWLLTPLGTLDQNKRKAAYVTIQQQMALDVPTIILYFWKDIYIYNNDLQNFTPSPVISAFWNPWEYSI